MARRTIVELTDDLDGGKAEETISFRLDGTGYEIDLSKANADKFRRRSASTSARPGGRAARRAAGDGSGNPLPVAPGAGRPPSASGQPL